MHTIIELSSLLIFCIYFLDAKKSKQLSLLFLAIFFAFIFENLSIIMSANQAGGYTYDANFNLFIWHTPLFIMLLWSVIIYSTYQIIYRIVKPKTFLFLAPLYILLLDIVLDQIATKLGLWTWHGFENYTDFFSVPASNYIGWLLLAFSFILTYEYFKDRKTIILQPLLAFFLFLILSSPLYFLKITFFDKSLFFQYSIFIILVVIFIFLSLRNFERNAIRSDKNLTMFIVRSALHFFSLGGLIYFGLRENIFLVTIFLGVLIFEYYIFREYVKNESVENRHTSSPPSKKTQNIV